MTPRTLNDSPVPEPLPTQDEVRTVLLLDSNTVNQIAAGEVVERPAAVLKELIENSIDAKATRISIEIEDSGSGLISVSDNGVGMSLADARMALQRHATSKISVADDLTRIETLGFRGEAVPSIASVSKFTLATSAGDDGRDLLTVWGGEFVAHERTAGPKGTTVEVRDLFFNTPARLKFLKSATTELGQCLEVVVRYALSHPDIAFVLRHNGNEAVATSGGGDLLDALSGVWSREIARALVAVEGEIAGIRVRGYVSPPHLTKPNRAMQFVFVNGRPVKSRTLTAAIDQAYRMLTPEKRYPIVVLRLDIAADRIDVNVSPTKSEIKFQQEGAAFDAVRYAIKQALLDSGMIPTADDIAIANEALAHAGGQSAMAMTGGWPGTNGGPVLGWPRETPRADSESPENSNQGAPMEPVAAGQPGEPFLPQTSSRYPFGDLLDGLKVLGQIMNTFIVAENRKGLVVIDQHVAHERVLFEYLCGLKGPTAIEVQRLLAPEPLHLDRRSAALFMEQIDLVRDVGFDVEPFGGESFVVRAAPAALRGQSPIKVLRDLIDEIVESSVARRLTPTREAIWIMSSCKMAIKAGDPLSIAEMEKLIADLAQTENPYLCPHGRPITVTLGADELLRKFGRK